MTRSTALPGLAVALAAAVLVAGCNSLSSDSLTLPTIPPPSFDWLTGGSNKPGPLPAVTTRATASVIWRAEVGKAGPGFAPAITPDAVYAAAQDGTLARFDPATGRTVWRINAGQKLEAGPGAGASLVVVGTDKGKVLAFDGDGKPRWTGQVSSEVISPPIVAGDVVVVQSGDGRIYGLAGDTGKTQWVDPRTLPPLTIRNSAGGIETRGGVFIGTAGGRLIALASETGAIGWDGTVAVPKGSTELDRIADVTSLPFIDENEVCAAAYQGRIACFDLVRGTLLWTRDISSLAGISGDTSRIYVVAADGSVQALDRSNGASVWKQDALAKRRIGGPQVIGDDVAVIDVEGYLHLIARSDGRYVGRLATDGSAATAQPARFGGGILWQSRKGDLYAVTAR
ncbi:MAG: outer membrane protein assembly factor BamB [Proteobacteria bacterium]|nr:outer membrane protein assembly factor BamB [Pseudomonadota bacterium]